MLRVFVHAVVSLLARLVVLVSRLKGSPERRWLRMMLLVVLLYWLLIAQVVVTGLVVTAGLGLEL